MAKDPAFLFYSESFLVGTLAMPFIDRGRYITLLCYIHQNGRVDEETILTIIGEFSNVLRGKFCKDENGLFYNKRLEIEADKRLKFVESRQNNGLKGGRPPVNQIDKKENLNKTDRLGVAKPTNNLVINKDIIINTIKYLNEKINSDYKSETKATVNLITNLIKLGYTESDFKKVIDVKYANWVDTEWSTYLRPNTLFGPKFESYLNEKIKPKQTGTQTEIPIYSQPINHDDRP